MRKYVQASMTEVKRALVITATGKRGTLWREQGPPVPGPLHTPRDCPEEI